MTFQHLQFRRSTIAWFILLCIGCFSNAKAQRWKWEKQYNFITADISSSYFRNGDIKFASNRFINPGGGLSFQRQVLPRISVGVSYKYDKPSAKWYYGTDRISETEWTLIRNEYRVPMHSVGLTANLYLIGNRGSFRMRPWGTLFLSGSWYHSVIRQQSRLKPDHFSNIDFFAGEKTDKTSNLLSLGLGYRMKLTPHFGISFLPLINLSSSRHISLNLMEDTILKQKDHWISFSVATHFILKKDKNNEPVYDPTFE